VTTIILYKLPHNTDNNRSPQQNQDKNRALSTLSKCNADRCFLVWHSTLKDKAEYNKALKEARTTKEHKAKKKGR
jgi:hypothetical protein